MLDQKFIFTSTFSLLIIFANMLNAGYSNYILSHENATVNHTSYVFIFITLIIGWSGLLFVILQNSKINTSKLLLVSISLIAMGNAFVLYKEMKFTKGESNETYQFNFTNPKLEFIIYIALFLLFTFSIPNNGDIQKKRQYTMTAGIIILISQLIVLPFQRRDRFVDGPSYIFLTTSWLILSKYIAERS